MNSSARSVLVLAGFMLGTTWATHANATAACNLKVPLTEEAEMQTGGARAKGGQAPAMGEGPTKQMPAMAKGSTDTMAGMKQDKMAGMAKTVSEAMTGMKGGQETGMKMGQMAGMKGAHEVHEGQYGGTFFMAPNKTHHIEGIYSKDCGFKLVVFNAMTQPINVRRFQAFVKFMPEDEDAFEAYRILTPSDDASVLQTASNPEMKGKFDVQLFVKFPEGDEPVMFNIPTGH